MDQVLVTGVSGFLGGRVALQLLAQGYGVLGSVREAGRIASTRDALGAAGADLDRLALCTLDLLSDAGWREAADRCRFTIHVASPFVTAMPKDTNPYGGVFGGWLMSQMALGAGSLASTSSDRANASSPAAPPAPAARHADTRARAPGPTATVRRPAALHGRGRGH